MKRAIEVLVDGERVGLLQAGDGGPVMVHIANVPNDHMRSWAHASSDAEVWRWQLPDVEDGRTISFRIVSAGPKEITPPHEVDDRDPAEVEETRKRAQEMYQKAMLEDAGDEDIEGI